MNMRIGTLVGLVVAVALAAGCGSSSAAGTNGGAAARPTPRCKARTAPS